MWTMQIGAGEQLDRAPENARAATRMRALTFAIQRLFYSDERGAEPGQAIDGWWLAPVEQVSNPVFADALRAAMAAASGIPAAPVP